MGAGTDLTPSISPPQCFTLIWVPPNGTEDNLDLPLLNRLKNKTRRELHKRSYLPCSKLNKTWADLTFYRLTIQWWNWLHLIGETGWAPFQSQSSRCQSGSRMGCVSSSGPITYWGLHVLLHKETLTPRGINQKVSVSLKLLRIILRGNIYIHDLSSWCWNMAWTMFFLDQIIGWIDQQISWPPYKILANSRGKCSPIASIIEVIWQQLWYWLCFHFVEVAVSVQSVHPLCQCSLILVGSFSHGNKALLVMSG